MTCVGLGGVLAVAEAAGRERGAGGGGLAGGLSVLLGLVGAAGMAVSGLCCVRRRGRSATCCFKVTRWACMAQSCSGSVSRSAGEAGILCERRERAGASQAV